MKYIIDIPDDTTCINTLKYEDSKCVAARSYIIPDLTPYTEPDRKAIEDEVWEFAWKMFYMDHVEYAEMFDDNECPSNYRDTKAKYEAWKAEKDEIKIGDEVIYNSRTKAIVLKPETKEKYGTILTINELLTVAVSHDELEKTGRHFNEVEELLKKMRDADEN